MFNFPQNLLRIRKQQKLTQQDLAERLNLTFQAISKWETGQSLPDLMQLTCLADYLGAVFENDALGSGGADVNAHGDDIFHKTSVRKTRSKRLAVPPAWRLMKHLRCTNAKGDRKPPFAAIPHREA